jgi:hypothetical protein
LLICSDLLYLFWLILAWTLGRESVSSIFLFSFAWCIIFYSFIFSLSDLASQRSYRQKTTRSCILIQSADMYSFGWDWVLNSGLHIFKTKTLPLERCLFYICFYFVFYIESHIFTQINIRLLSSHLCLQSSWN